MVQHVASGTFGVVYQKNDNIIKCAYGDAQSQQNLNNEIRILRRLKGQQGFPYMREYQQSVYICMDILGPGIDELLEECNGAFSLKTCLMIGYSMLQCLQRLHNNGIIHNDIKPDNFCAHNRKTICCIDFGLATFTNEEQSKKPRFVGTCRYASRNALRGEPCDFMDDVESVFYTIAFLYYGKLPWEGYPFDIKRERVLNDKITSGASFLKGFPQSIQKSFHCLATHSEKWMLTQFKRALTSEGYVLDYNFDWKKI